MYLISLVFIFLVALFLRSYGILENHPFWVDEFNTATQARLIIDHGLKIFTDKSLIFEFQNITTHFLVAGFFSVFGQHEWVARLPIVIIGSLVPIGVYFLTKLLSNRTTALVASILTTFSYFEIVWSRQARGYVLLQLLVLFTLFAYIKYVKPNKLNKKLSLLLITLVLLGVVTHYYYLLVIFAILCDFLWSHRKQIRNYVFSPTPYIFLMGLFIVIYGFGGITVFQSFLRNNAFSTNNIGYYHSFLWREYGLITFLSLMGWITLLLKGGDKTKSILLYIIMHLTFVTFFFGHHMSKYLLPVFPLIIIGASKAIADLSKLICEPVKNQKLKKIAPLVIALFLVANGHKFVNRPESYYSINHDFREIANIDYNIVYTPILSQKDNRPVIIETWPGRAYWFLGNDYEYVYMFRWENEEGLANGHIKKTEFYLKNDEKRISEQIGFIGTTDDLKKVIKKYKTGFIFIDDASLPADVIQYAEKNLKKELFLDRYPLEENPYSIWPATLYSWGVQ